MNMTARTGADLALQFDSCNTGSMKVFMQSSLRCPSACPGWFPPCSCKRDGGLSVRKEKGSHLTSAVLQAYAIGFLLPRGRDFFLVALERLGIRFSIWPCPPLLHGTS